MNVYTIADNISALTAEQKAARKKKVKAGAKNFLWGISFVNLLPIRAAFNSIVAMNVNAFAHNLKWIYDNRNGITKKEWGKIKSVWKKVGGLEKALLKAIQLGAKHKPLFLSKKAKARFEKRQKARAGAKPIKGIYAGDVIGGPEVIAAAVAAASGIIAAIIPIVATALKKGGTQQQAAGEEVAAQGQELVNSYKQNPEKFGANAANAAEIEAAELEAAPGVNGIYEGEANPYASLFSALGQVAQVGITAAGNEVAKKAKKNKKVAKALSTANQGVEDYATGRYLRESGYKKTAQSFMSAGGTLQQWALPAAAAVAAIFLLKGKK
jgi:ferritin-like metal-binding protein YciE